MLDYIIAFKPRVGLEDSNLFTELDDKTIEGITGGQQQEQQSYYDYYYKCDFDRFIKSYDDYYWFGGSRACRRVPRYDVPEEVLQESQG
ncbi:hypothetical protein LC607_20340 [Nostoc sp. CHAB 5824]|nr:hypothetical protein [Nostoc sp. CHAB 5824]